jgi:4-hydroxy-tetrahydrodipicolinate synthase
VDKNERWRGLFPILPTPFRDDASLDVPSLERVIEHCLESGVRGLVEFGFASEFFKLTETERVRLTEVVVRRADGRVPVLIGTGGPSIPIAVERSRKAQDQGADGLMVVLPYVRPTTEAESRAYIEAIAGAVGIPIMIQDSPGMGVGTISAETLAELGRTVPLVQYVKAEEAPPGAKITRLLELAGGEITVFAGMGDLHMIELLERGASGFMPVCDTIELHVAVYEKFASGDRSGAREAYNRLLPWIAFSEQSYMRVSKEMLVRRGLIRSARLRAPEGGEMDREHLAEMDRIAGQLGL